jgi:hypothetical protein
MSVIIEAGERPMSTDSIGNDFVMRIASIESSIQSLTAALQRNTEVLIDLGDILRRQQTNDHPYLAPIKNATAGSRLMAVGEMVEMILLKAKPKIILLSQRVNRLFNAVVVNSRSLQDRLFFTARPSPSAAPRLNRIISHKATIQRLPFYLDVANIRIAYCSREGRRRLFYESAILEKDSDTRSWWLKLGFTTSSPKLLLDPVLLGARSWRSMYFAQGIRGTRCLLKVYDLESSTRRHRQSVLEEFNGTVEVEFTLDQLLEALSTMAVEPSRIS